jgi:hypothetical protein
LACAECDDSLPFQEFLPFLPVIYLYLPLFSTNYSSIFPLFFLPSISWSISWSCFEIHIQYSLLLGCHNRRPHHPQPPTPAAEAA